MHFWKLEVPTVDKVRENQSRWFSHMQRRLVSLPIKIDNRVVRTKGKSKRTQMEAIRKGLKNDLLSGGGGLNRTEWNKRGE